MVDALRAQVRVDAGRDPEPSAGLMDSQPIKGADTVGADTRGYDAGKKINGRKRFIVTDILGLLLVVLVLPASVQDRDGARNLLLELRHRQLMSRAARRVRHLFADAGFAGSLIDWARDLLKTTIEVVRKPRGQKGFAVIPRRWAVERTFAWITAYRRPGPRLRTPPRHRRSHHPLGHQHHDPTHRPRNTSHTSRTTHIQGFMKISNTLSGPVEFFDGVPPRCDQVSPPGAKAMSTRRSCSTDNEKYWSLRSGLRWQYFPSFTQTPFHSLHSGVEQRSQMISARTRVSSDP